MDRLEAAQKELDELTSYESNDGKDRWAIGNGLIVKSIAKSI